jgi:hypothetical protein
MGDFLRASPTFFLFRSLLRLLGTTRVWAEKFSLAFLHIITLPFATMENDQVRPQAQTGAERMWILYRNSWVVWYREPSRRDSRSGVPTDRSSSARWREWRLGTESKKAFSNSGIAVKTLQEPKTGPLEPFLNRRSMPLSIALSATCKQRFAGKHAPPRALRLGNVDCVGAVNYRGFPERVIPSSASGEECYAQSQKD